MHIGIRKGIRGRWGLFILLLVFLWPILALALSASQVFEQVKDSVVVVKSLNRQGKQVGLGSGVVLPSGEVANNHHVATAGERLQVGAHGRYVPAFLLASDPERDLALLSAPGLAATPARLGRAGGLKVGDKVFAVGAPYGLELSLSEGIVSQLRGGPPPLIQTTAPISQGSSGGGLFNDRGELVGLTTFYLKGGQGLNFALPVEFLTELAAGKKQRPPARAAPVTPPGPAASGDWLDRALMLMKANKGVIAIFLFGALMAVWSWLKQVVSTLISALHSLPGRFWALLRLDWSERAVALSLAGRWLGLAKHCRRWTQAQPDNAATYLFLGLAYNILFNHQEAVEAFREAVRLEPDQALAWYNLGVSYVNLGRWQEAVEACREAVRLMPDFAEA